MFRTSSLTREVIVRLSELEAKPIAHSEELHVSGTRPFWHRWSGMSGTGIASIRECRLRRYRNVSVSPAQQLQYPGPLGLVV